MELIARRVKLFGGDPGKIPPSPIGAVPAAGGPGDHHGHEHTGKVAGLIYDGFGDFEGFILETHGGEHRYVSREDEVQALVKRAWSERLRITVFAEPGEPHRAAAVIVREPPASFDDN